jgi:hypothetical protein
VNIFHLRAGGRQAEVPVDPATDEGSGPLSVDEILDRLAELTADPETSASTRTWAQKWLVGFETQRSDVPGTARKAA